MPSASAPSMSSAIVSPTITAVGRLDAEQIEHGAEDRGVRLRVAVVERADAGVDVEAVVEGELLHVSRGVRNESDAETGRAERGERPRDVVVELEVLVPLPAARDLDRAGVGRVGVSAHAADDALGEAKPDLVVVLELGMAAKIDEGGVASRFVAAGLEHEPVALAGADVALGPELRAWPREREVDVEEDGAQLVRLGHPRYPMARFRGVAQPGSALRSGRRGPQFESGHPDFPEPRIVSAALCGSGTESPGIPPYARSLPRPLRTSRPESDTSPEWSSHRALVGLAAPLRFHDVEGTLRLFSANRDAAQMHYAAYVAERLRRPNTPLPDMSSPQPGSDPGLTARGRGSRHGGSVGRAQT